MIQVRLYNIESIIVSLKGNELSLLKLKLILFYQTFLLEEKFHSLCKTSDLFRLAINNNSFL